jgi:hypothetical protein
MRYRPRTLPIIAAVPAILMAALCGAYGYAAAVASRPHGDITFGVAAAALLGGLIGLVIGSILWAVPSFGFRFTIRDVLWLTLSRPEGKSVEGPVDGLGVAEVIALGQVATDLAARAGFVLGVYADGDDLNS